MHCTYCGNALTEAAVFCPKCGNRVSPSQSEGSSSKPGQIPSTFVQPTVYNSRIFRILLYLAILFGGVIFTDWTVSEVFSLPAEATYHLTKMSLNAAIGVAVLGMVFARRWVTWKVTLIATVLVSVGIILLVLSIWNTHRDYSSTESLPAAPLNVDQQQPFLPDLVLDDVAPGDDGATFETAFTHDPTCDGLKLMRWKSSTENERAALSEQRYWWVDFWGRQYNLQTI